MKITFSILLSLLLFAGCSNGDDGPQPVCGDFRIDPGEECDKDKLDGKTCADLGFDRGELACSANCTFDTSGCENLFENCGNQKIDAGEDCDGDLLNDATCLDLGFAGGELACAGDCSFDTSGCRPVPCGDGAVGLFEECDGENLSGLDCLILGFSGGTLACSDQCQLDGSGCSGCSEDASEENDDPQSAAAIASGEHAFFLCNTGGEEDWFSVQLGAGETLAVAMAIDATLPDLDLQLQDEQGAVLDSGTSTTTLETVSHKAAADLPVLIRVYSHSDFPGAVGYALNIRMNPGCLKNADCPAGQVCTDFICSAVACSVSDPCPGDLVCNAGFCAECVTAADCPDENAYVCQDNLCVFSCAEDAHEPNSAPGSAAALALPALETGLTLCGEMDEDWFQIDLLELTRYRIDLGFENALGDVDVAVYAPGDLEIPLAQASSGDDDEHLVMALPSGAGGAHLVRVLLLPGAHGQVYDLAAASAGAVECAEDQDCPTQGDLCLDFSCTAPACLEDADCTGDDRCVDYQCAAEPAGDSCDDPLVIASLPFSATDVDIAPHRDRVALADDTCTGAGTGGKDAVYRLTLAAGDLLIAELRADYDAAIYLLGQCTAAPAAEACLAGSDLGAGGEAEFLYYGVEADGSYYLVVDAFAPGYPDTGSFALTVSVE